MDLHARVICAALIAFQAWGCGDDGSDAGLDAGDGGIDAPVDAPMDAGADASDAAPDTGPASLCPMGACDLLSNEGCDIGTGMVCYFIGNMPTCAPAGTAGNEEACTSTTDCQEGFFCDSSARLCRKVCCGGSDASCPLGQTCRINLVDEMGMSTGVGLCLRDFICDLLDQTGCEEEPGCVGVDPPCACYPVGGDGSLACAQPRDMKVENDPCGAINECSPGHTCGGPAGGDTVCLRFCDMTTGEPCRDGQMCGRLTGAPMGVGVCNPPMSP